MHSENTAKSPNFEAVNRKPDRRERSYILTDLQFHSRLTRDFVHAQIAMWSSTIHYFSG